MIRHFLAAVVLAAYPITASAVMDYTHWAEGAIIMIAQDLFSSKANVINIGESSKPGIYQFAIKYGRDPEQQDNSAKNAVLFECGMHAREWYATESCYWLMDYLYRHNNDSEVQALLEEADVWIIPQSNPAGRDLDDPALGDPTEFTYVCKGGTDAGNACNRSSDCSGGDCYSSGWRTNANTASCYAGVDLARNFSSGWDDAAVTCNESDFMKFRGSASFSEVETLNLRRFIHNHMISMVLIQHAQSEEIDHRWRSRSLANDYMVDELVRINTTGSASWSPNPGMAKSSVGGGYGQFSGWLTQDSDVSGELDESTKRNIATFFFELPISPGSNYYGTAYQDTASDGSNTFHPSGNAMKSLWDDAIFDLLTYVIRQARSPSCPVNSTGTRVTSACEGNDFGLVGAKIASSASKPGLLDYDSSTREEVLPWGVGRRVVFAVQNFSSSPASTSTQATVTIERNGSVVATRVLPISLSGGDRGIYTVSHSFSAGGEYRVSISLDSDDLSKNNEKVFSFRVKPLKVTSIAELFGTATIEFVPPKAKEEYGYIDFTGQFPGIRLRPHLRGVKLTILSYLPWISGPNPEPEAIKLALPPGKTWWRRAKVGKGWIYTDTQSINGPVQKLIVQESKSNSQNKPVITIDMKINGEAAKSLQRGRAWTVSFRQPKSRKSLNAIAVATDYKFVDRENRDKPTDDIENEPNN